ncbi:hypothetical protein K435DRAFT_880431 [Dendrothele bispora CBS 962.96]|uniref:Uncharacterized protein n=1 Tax=Dendrothele bispora (strain CBS 962.96) TaxID=1314807 RepID=A0A4S8KJU7_DENBC|nr:hypothetical protein K435DRAFT_880431 [Dendrothele bispora CBS 962.96]
MSNTPDTGHPSNSPIRLNIDEPDDDFVQAKKMSQLIIPNNFMQLLPAEKALENVPGLEG